MKSGITAAASRVVVPTDSPDSLHYDAFHYCYLTFGYLLFVWFVSLSTIVVASHVVDVYKYLYLYNKPRKEKLKPKLMM
jgi:hypothetical protein